MSTPAIIVFVNLKAYPYSITSIRDVFPNIKIRAYTTQDNYSDYTTTDKNTKILACGCLYTDENIDTFIGMDIAASVPLLPVVFSKNIDVEGGEYHIITLLSTDTYDEVLKEWLKISDLRPPQKAFAYHLYECDTVLDVLNTVSHISYKPKPPISNM